MRGDTYIDYEHNKGFWLEERFLEVLSFYVCLVFEERGFEDKPEWYTEVYDDFLMIIHGYNTGNQGFLFDDNLEFKKEREVEIISILEETKELLRAKGKEISPKELIIAESRKTAPHLVNNWPFPIQTNSFITILDFMIQLFKYKWKEDRRVWFEGYPYPEGADVI